MGGQAWLRCSSSDPSPAERLLSRPLPGRVHPSRLCHLSQGQGRVPGSSAHGGSLSLTSNPTTGSHSLPSPMAPAPQAMPLANSPKARSPRVRRPGQPHGASAQDGPPAPALGRRGFSGTGDTSTRLRGQVHPGGRERCDIPCPPLPSTPSSQKALFPGICWQVGDYIRTTVKQCLEQEADPAQALAQQPGAHPAASHCQRRRGPAFASHQLPVLLATGTLQGCTEAATFKKRLPFRRTWRGEAPLS